MGSQKPFQNKKIMKKLKSKKAPSMKYIRLGGEIYKIFNLNKVILQLNIIINI